MIIKNARLVLSDKVIENGFLEIKDGKISNIGEAYAGSDSEVIDAKGNIIMPGFIDVHIHGSAGIDFMDASKDDFKTISESLYNEGVTTYLATTLTSDNKSLARVCKTVKKRIS